MATNPNNAVGTNAAYGGRTSVKAFNDVLGVFNGRGILSGWGTAPSSGMTVAVGGNGSVRDVAIAENNTGDRTTIDNISENPVPITIPAAPASNSRYDLIVAYVDNPPNGVPTVADNPSAVGIIVVSGTAAASPTVPSDGDIRSAITVDGGSGATAYYVIIATVLVASGTTDITSNMITAGVSAQIPGASLVDDSVTSDKIDSATMTVGSERVVGYLDSTNQPIYEQKFSGSISITSPNVSTGVNLISGISDLLSVYGYMERNSTQFPLPYVNTTAFTSTPVTFDEFGRIYRDGSGTVILNLLSLSTRSYTYTVVLRYTKS